MKKKTINIFFQLNFEYDLLSKVLRIIKENSIIIQNQKLEINCELIISVRKSDANKIVKIFDTFYKVQIKSLDI